MNKNNKNILIIIFLVLYSSLVNNNSPKFIIRLFENSIFRILLLGLIIYYGNSIPELSLMLSIGFIITMNIILKKKLFENFNEMTGLPRSDDIIDDVDILETPDVTNINTIPTKLNIKSRKLGEICQINNKGDSNCKLDLFCGLNGKCEKIRFKENQKCKIDSDDSDSDNCDEGLYCDFNANQYKCKKKIF